MDTPGYVLGTIITGKPLSKILTHLNYKQSRSCGGKGDGSFDGNNNKNKYKI